MHIWLALTHTVYFFSMMHNTVPWIGTSCLSFWWTATRIRMIISMRTTMTTMRTSVANHTVVWVAGGHKITTYIVHTMGVCLYRSGCPDWQHYKYNMFLLRIESITTLVSTLRYWDSGQQCINLQCCAALYMYICANQKGCKLHYSSSQTHFMWQTYTDDIDQEVIDVVAYKSKMPCE